MRLVCSLRTLSVAAVFCVACGGTTEPNPNPKPLPTPSVACADKPLVQLAVGEHAVVDPAAAGGCLRIPADAGSGAQYLVVLASTNGTPSTSGVQGPYLLRASSPLTAVMQAPEPLPASPAPSTARRSVAAEFDATLRTLEGLLAADRRNRPGPLIAPPPAPAPPVVGEVKSFKVCANLTCSSFTTVQATAKFVGQHAAIFQDNDVPQNDPLQNADFAELGTAFDDRHYPIDTTAFGRESDQDNNGVVIVLMTDAVNGLTPDCHNGRVIGFFFGGDLLAGPNSNHGEIFYTLVPAPAIPDKCDLVTRRIALDKLKPTLIHEFQHMISWNQRVLIRGGTSEVVWLNEAMSHFAEELGGRLIPNAECVSSTIFSCRSQYTSDDIGDAYDYLKDPESEFLIFPSASQGTLAERGAAWLFLRWALDQFAADTILGTATTRALVATSLSGVNNLTAVTGGSFSVMVPEWLMAAYLDDGPDLPQEATGRLRFKSWGLREIWLDPRNAQHFPSGFPVVPLTIGSGFSRTGTLRGGSGRHFLVFQVPQGPALDLQVLKNANGSALDPLLAGRFGIVRIQ